MEDESCVWVGKYKRRIPKMDYSRWKPAVNYYTGKTKDEYIMSMDKNSVLRQIEHLTRDDNPLGVERSGELVRICFLGDDELVQLDEHQPWYPI